MSDVELRRRSVLPFFVDLGGTDARGMGHGKAHGRFAEHKRRSTHCRSVESSTLWSQPWCGKQTKSWRRFAGGIGW